MTDLEAEKRVVTGHGGPGPEGATSVANHATEAVTDATAAAGTEDHLAGREAESETDGTAGETQKTETRGRVQRSQRAEDETEAPKNDPPRDREAESEMIDRVAGRGRKRATVEAAIQRAMLINRRKEKGARVRNLKREQRTNLKVQSKRKRTRLPVTVTERLHVPLHFMFSFPPSMTCCTTMDTKRHILVIV